MNDLYYDPAKFGLETIGEIDWSSGSYEFDYTVVWRRTSDGAFVFGEDSGCSCPSPFEDTGVDDLKPVASLAEFQEHLMARSAEPYGYARDVEIAELLERLRTAGLPAGVSA
jgi:hypothetical protein